MYTHIYIYAPTCIDVLHNTPAHQLQPHHAAACEVKPRAQYFKFHHIRLHEISQCIHNISSYIYMFIYIPRYISTMYVLICLLFFVRICADLFIYV